MLARWTSWSAGGRRSIQLSRSKYIVKSFVSGSWKLCQYPTEVLEALSEVGLLPCELRTDKDIKDDNLT